MHIVMDLQPPVKMLLSNIQTQEKKSKGKQPAKKSKKVTMDKGSGHLNPDDFLSSFDDSDNDPDYIPPKKKKVEENVKIQDKNYGIKRKKSIKKKVVPVGKLIYNQ